jgi:hypothetical protein
MRANEFLPESQGGIFRRAQEVDQGAEIKFKNAETNQEIKLIAAEVFPQNGQFQTSQELEQAISDFCTMFEVPSENIQYTGTKLDKARAAIISIWTELSTGEPMAFIKLAAKRGTGAAPILQTNAEFKKSFGYGDVGKTAQRQTLQLKPKDVLAFDEWLNPQGVIRSVANRLKTRSDLDENIKQGLVQLVSNVAKGVSQPVPYMGQYETSLEVDYGEVPAPIALVTGNFVSGDYQKAEEGLLKPLGLTWGSLSNILYPKAGGEKIYDSYIQIDAKNKLKISSKDKKGGAAASITGLIDEISNNPEKFQDVLLNKKYKPLLEMLKVIANPENRFWNRSNKGINGPLILGIDTFGFIDDNDARTIVGLMDSPNNKLNPEDAYKKRVISRNLYALVKVKGAKYNDPAYNLGFHLLACVAKNIANIVNQDPNTDMLFRAILERSNMVQVKTTVRKMGDGAAFTDFKVVYPPIFQGKMIMVADNNYMATRKPIAPLSFAIK